MHTTHCVTGKILDWFRSYLSGRYQSVQFTGETSSPVLVPHGVPQDSVLGPLLFITYTSDIPGNIISKGLLCMCYADDRQSYFHLKPSNLPVAKLLVENCINRVHQWLTENRLRLNPDKAKGMWCANSRRTRLANYPPLLVR